MSLPKKETLEKRCLVCDCRIVRKYWKSGAIEDLGSYEKRRFCSLSCSSSRGKGGLSRKAFHARARKKKKSACEACGGTFRLHVHHVNEDWKNNDDSNLQTLCIFCHQFWHATYRRLKINPWMKMPKIVPDILEAEKELE